MGYFRTLKWRKRMGYFLGVCIPLRILIGIALWFLFDPKYKKPTPQRKIDKALMTTIAVIGSASTILLALLIQDTSPWWSRVVEMLVAFAMTGYAFAWLIKESNDEKLEAKWISVIWFLDIAIGLFFFSWAYKAGEFQVQNNFK